MYEVSLPLASGLRLKIQHWSVVLDTGAAALRGLSGGANSAAQSALNDVLASMESLLDADSEAHAESVARPLTGSMTRAGVAENDDRLGEMEESLAVGDDLGGGRQDQGERRDATARSGPGDSEKYRLLSSASKAAARAFKAGRKRKPRRRRSR